MNEIKKVRLLPKKVRVQNKWDKLNEKWCKLRETEGVTFTLTTCFVIGTI